MGGVKWHQNRIGVDNAIEGGVDVLAHTVPTEPGYTAEELARFKSQHTALIPPLSLWTTIVPNPAITGRVVQLGVNQLKTFQANGGPVLFGTDVGFINIYDTSLKFEIMHRALSESELLASLTTNPAKHFHATHKRRVERGFDADLAVLDADPAADVRNLAEVAYTVRAGKIIFQKP